MMIIISDYGVVGHGVSSAGQHLHRLESHRIDGQADDICRIIRPGAVFSDSFCPNFSSSSAATAKQRIILISRLMYGMLSRR